VLKSAKTIASNIVVLPEPVIPDIKYKLQLPRFLKGILILFGYAPKACRVKFKGSINLPPC
jgi:hypothetical protein